MSKYSLLQATITFPFLCRFKIDINYVGEPPAVEITITNLNDNIDVVFLKDLIRKCGGHDEPIIYYHPITHKHLGFARVVFETVKSANACIEKFNGTSVMGKVSRLGEGGGLNSRISHSLLLLFLNDYQLKK